MTKAEKIILVLTVAFVLFALGARFGSHRDKESMTIAAEPRIEEQVGRVNINTADIAELTTLPGVGELVAGEIVAYREENGPFPEVDGLQNVPGMNKQLFEMIHDHIRVK